MENENKTPQTQEPTGWGQVTITPDMPLGAIIQFMNILNGRLATVENLISITLQDGEAVTLTELYRRQAEAEMQAQSENKGE